LLFLENGLRALLISDVDGEDQSSVDDMNQSESDDESAGSDNSGKGSDNSGNYMEISIIKVKSDLEVLKPV
jgi:hypothetical protein